jgi:hypothetical protein
VPKSYWIVSPNVRDNEATVSDWKKASILKHAAFMGWPLSHPIGNRFALTIQPRDIILIARRHNLRPELVGFGIVRGKYKTKGIKTPQRFATWRKLSPFIALSEAPARVPISQVLRHTKALVRLHPRSRRSHAAVCGWMNKLLSKYENVGSTKNFGKSKAEEKSVAAELVDSPKHHQLDYIIHSKGQITKAKKNEARLVMEYSEWLARQDHKLVAAKYGKLQCDGFEKERLNLIEAKSSTSREHIRMAAGQLLDYAFQIKKTFGKPHKAVLLPKKPEASSVNWLSPLGINVIWREKGAFFDNADGKFT